MKRALILLATATMWLGCNGGNSQNEFKPAFAGSWTGIRTLALEGFPTMDFAEQINIDVSESGVTLANACPGGGGSITAIHEPAYPYPFIAGWGGTLVCPPISVAGVCSSMVFTFTSVHFFLALGDATVFVDWSGSAVGCGGSLELKSFSFVGQKGAGGLNPAFSKTWNGVEIITLTGQAPITISPKQVSILASGNMAEVYSQCPDNTGRLMMIGSGHTAFMENERVTSFYGCGAQPVGSCAQVEVLFDSSTLTLGADNTTVTLQVSGYAWGCDTSWGVTFSFTGT